MAKVISLPSSKKTIYNGTSGNASVAIGSATVTAAVGDTVKLFSLDVGVQLATATISNAAFGAGVKGKVYCLPKGEAVATKYQVTEEIDMAAAKVTNSDDHGWFPTSLEDVPHDVVIVITGAAATKKALSYRIMTTSIGNL
jgi:hypothetical protein